MSKANVVSEMTDITECLAKTVLTYETDIDWETLRDEVEDYCQQLLALCAEGEDDDSDEDGEDDDDAPQELVFGVDEEDSDSKAAFEDDEEFN